MGYTIKNLKDTKDSAPEFGLSGDFEAHFPMSELGAQTIGLGYQVLGPNVSSPFAHRHDQAEEIYVVLSGGGRIVLDGEPKEISALDAIRVEPKVACSFEAGGEGLEVLVFGPRHEGDGEIIR